MGKQLKFTWKQVVRGSILLLIMNVVFIVGLLGTVLIPKDAVRTSLLRSADIMAAESDYADGLILDIAASQQADFPFWSIIMNPSQMGDGSPEWMPQNIRDMVAGEVEPDTYYDWVWHGYLTIVKPLLIQCDYSQIRQILIWLVVALALFGLWQTGMKAGKWGVLFLTVCGALYFLCVPHTLRYASAATIAFLGLDVLFSRSRYMEKDGHDYWYFFVIGGIMAFFDHWAPALAGLIIPLVPWIMFKKRPRKVRQVVLFTMNRIWGYIAVIGSKWLLCALTFDRDVFLNAEHVLLSFSAFPLV